MKGYAVVIEKTGNGFGAYVPDLPGCIAAGDTVAETKRLIRGAIKMHLEGMRADGDPIPKPTTVTTHVNGIKQAHKKHTAKAQRPHGTHHWPATRKKSATQQVKGSRRRVKV